MKPTTQITGKNIMGEPNRLLKEYEAGIDSITAEERRELHKWIADGNSPYDNPCLLYEEDGCLMDYISAIRINDDMLNNPDYYQFGTGTAPDNTDGSLLF